MFQRPDQRTETTLSFKIMKCPLPYSQSQVSVARPSEVPSSVSRPMASVQQLSQLSAPCLVSQFSAPHSRLSGLFLHHLPSALG